MKCHIEDLRNHLFVALEALQDEDNPMDLERARTIGSIAQTIINTAKVEVAFLKEVGGVGTGFMPVEKKAIGDAGAYNK